MCPWSRHEGTKTASGQDPPALLSRTRTHGEARATSGLDGLARRPPLIEGAARYAVGHDS